MPPEDLLANVIAATQPTPRRERALLLARTTSVILGLIQIAIALPDLLSSHVHDAHSPRHVAAFAIAIGTGLVYAGIRPHRASGLIAPLLALTVSLLVTCFVDIVHGRWPSELDIHLISPVAAGALWALAHLARPELRTSLREARLRAVPDPVDR